jgi:hypothetical protein
MKPSVAISLDFVFENGLLTELELKTSRLQRQVRAEYRAILGEDCFRIADPDGWGQRRGQVKGVAPLLELPLHRNIKNKQWGFAVPVQLHEAAKARLVEAGLDLLWGRAVLEEFVRDHEAFPELLRGCGRWSALC